MQASEDGVTLSALVDSTSSVVRKAVYGGDPFDLAARPVETLCGILENKPMQECSDHAVIRLEFALRDHAAPRPVAGIVQSENADPAFALPQRLVRAWRRPSARRRAALPRPTASCRPPPIPGRNCRMPSAAVALQAMIDGHPAGAEFM